MATLRQLWGARIAAARQAAGMNGAQLAEALGVAPSSITRWESGELAPRVEMREPIAEALGVDVDWLFRHANGDDEPEPVAVA